MAEIDESACGQSCQLLVVALHRLHQWLDKLHELHLLVVVASIASSCFAALPAIITIIALGCVRFLKQADDLETAGFFDTSPRHQVIFELLHF